MDASQKLKQHYPWIQTPLVVGAPMRLIALAEMAVEVSKAGGIGFIGAGTDISKLSQHLTHATHLLQAHTPLPTTHSTLPIGIGFINWGCPLSPSISLITQFRPCAVWFFAPSSLSSLHAWVKSTRHASPATRIWVQVGSVHEAIQVTKLVHPHVLVIQGTDAGGHGLLRGASLLTLVPEVCDALQSESDFSTTTADQGPTILAAGGITDPRTAASCLLLGASGLVLGTRLLATPQAQIAPGYQRAVLAATDGGQTTVRTKVYDELRGTTGWAATHNARAIINQSYLDAVDNDMSGETNKNLYRRAEAMAAKANENHNLLCGITGRLTTYAGTGVGLITEVKEAGDVVREIRHGAKDLLERPGQKAKL